MDPQPGSDRPIYAYIDVEIGEPGTGDEDPIGDPALQISKYGNLYADY